MEEKRIVAYTYFLQWTSLNKKYYGVRYNKILEERHPEDDFWIYYKGSSRDRSFDKKLGTYNGIEPDVKRIHKIFFSKKEALLFEQKFLKRIRAKYKDDWLNKSDKDGLLITEDFCRKMKERPVTWKVFGWPIGKKHTDETKKILSDMRTGEKNPFYGKKHSSNSLEKNKLANLYYTYEILSPNGNKITVNSLKQFCKDHSLGYSNMRQRNFSKGYKVLSKTKVKNE